MAGVIGVRAISLVRLRSFHPLALLAPFVLFKHRTAASTGGRKLPILQCFTAAAWGPVMPGSPLTMISKGMPLSSPQPRYSSAPPP
jgi:hypothetical protein